MFSVFGSVFLTGFVLGWSVAWPPGPINAEAVRRGLSRQLWQAYAVILGGCFGDALWALLVGFGTDRLLRVARLQSMLGAISVGLLLVFGGFFLHRAWRRSAALRAGKASGGASPLHSSRGSFVLGFTLALTSPWNIAFWLAVIGQAQGMAPGLFSSLVIASGVLVGAATWGVILCIGVARLGSRFAKPSWEILTQFATGGLMIYFAFRTAIRLIGTS